jgi:SPP1 family predicted phage head-tail adaptor
VPLRLSNGEFKKKVIFKKPSTVRNNEGGIEKGFTDEILTWAAERKIDARRVMEAGGTAQADTRLLYVKYAAGRDAINNTWLLEIDGMEHTITSKVLVQESGLKVFEITAKAKHV